MVVPVPKLEPKVEAPVPKLVVPVVPKLGVEPAPPNRGFGAFGLLKSEVLEAPGAPKLVPPPKDGVPKVFVVEVPKEVPKAGGLFWLEPNKPPCC